MLGILVLKIYSISWIADFTHSGQTRKTNLWSYALQGRSNRKNGCVVAAINPR